MIILYLINPLSVSFNCALVVHLLLVSKQIICSGIHEEKVFLM